MEYILHYVDETSTARQAIIHSSPQILSYAIETEFDFCDLCDLENQGHDPKTERLPQGLWGSYILGFTLIAVKLLSYHMEMVSSDRWKDEDSAITKNAHLAMGV